MLQEAIRGPVFSRQQMCGVGKGRGWRHGESLGDKGQGRHHCINLIVTRSKAVVTNHLRAVLALCSAQASVFLLSVGCLIM